MEAGKGMRRWLVVVIFMVMLALGQNPVGVSAVHAANPSPETTKTDRVFKYLNAQVPEIATMARSAKSGRLVMSLEQVPEASGTSRFERDYFQVYVGSYIEDGGAGHRSRWATFLVHKDLDEVLWANFLTGDTYVPLADWRRSILGVNDSQKNDWMCIPFMRVGPILSYSTLEEITQAFGAANLERRKVFGAEGIESFDATIVYPGTADELIVFWEENRYGKRPESVSIRGSGGKWRTLNGIKLGSSLAELNRVNRRPFSLAGFGWDYGGRITENWNGGRMADMKGLMLTLQPTGELPQEYYGDRRLSSDLPALLPDRVVVRRIDIQLK